MILGTFFSCFLSQTIHILSIFMQIHSRNLRTNLTLIKRETFQFSLLLLFISSLFTFFSLYFLSISNFANTEIITLIIIIILARISLKSPFPISINKYIKILIIQILFFFIFSYVDSNVNFIPTNPNKTSNGTKESANVSNNTFFDNEKYLIQFFFPDEIQFIIKVVMIILMVIFDFLSITNINRRNTRKFIFLSYGLSITYLVFTFKSNLFITLNKETNFFSKIFARFIVEFSIATLIYAFELTKMLYYHDSSDLATYGFFTFYILIIIITIFNRFVISSQFHNMNKSVDNSKSVNNSMLYIIFSKISFCTSKSTFSILGLFLLITATSQIITINIFLKRIKSLSYHREQLIDVNALSHDLFSL